MLPPSMNMAPPPVMRRVSVTPSRRAASRSTSLRTDWNTPSTTAVVSHSQMRSVGGRRPAATSRLSTSSSAACMAGETAGSWMICHSKSRQVVASPNARRTAMATASGLKPNSMASDGRAARMAVASCAVSAVVGRPSSACRMLSSALSGSRKKSPDTCTWVSLPSCSCRSTTTSLPPGTLYSPCLVLIGRSFGMRGYDSERELFIDWMSKNSACLPIPEQQAGPTIEGRGPRGISPPRHPGRWSSLRPRR